MDAQKSESAVEYEGVRVSERALAEVASGQVMVQVSRSEILDLALCWGFSAERPLLQLAAGVLLVVLGGAFGLRVIGWVLQGGVIFSRYEGLAVGLIPLGGWLIHATLQRRYYLLVRTGSDVRKFSFSKGATRQEVIEFANRSSQILGCAVRIEVPDSAGPP